MFQAMLPISAFVSFWPGDDVEANLLDSNDYKALSSRRMTSIQEFLRSAEFTSSVLKGCMSSFVTWRYIREVEADPSKRPKFIATETTSDSEDEYEYVSVPGNMRGIARGQKGFLEEARKLAKSKNRMAEFFINRSNSPGILRLEVYRTVAATLAYLSDKNMPYTASIWMFLVLNAFGSISLKTGTNLRG